LDNNQENNEQGSLEAQGAQRHEDVQRMARRRRRRRRRRNPKVKSSTWVPQLEEGLLLLAKKAAC